MHRSTRFRDIVPDRAFCFFSSGSFRDVVKNILDRMGFSVRVKASRSASGASAGRARSAMPAMVCATLLLGYCLLAYLASGGDTWWHIDFVYRNNIFWGDDAYRFFLVRSAWHEPDLYFFNFLLPGQLVLDGILTSLAGDDLLGTRYLKAVLAVAAVAAIYRASLRLGAAKGVAMASAALLALLPLYAFVAMSFYGESWLLVLVCFALYAFVCGRPTLGAFIVALMPLVRIEGLAFVIPLCAMGVLRRDWRMVFLPASLGFVYLLLVIGVGPGIKGFLGWRAVTGEVYRAAETYFGGNLDRFAAMLSVSWLAFASIGYFSRANHHLLPFLGGAWLLIAFSLFSLINDMASFEPRYVVAAMPVFALGFALSGKLVLDHFRTRRHGGWALPGLVVFAFVLGWQNLASSFSVQQLQMALKGSGSRVALADELERGTSRSTQRELDGYRELAKVVTQMTHVNPDIETLVVAKVMLFYFLDPAELPARVTVVWPLSQWKGLIPLLGGDKSLGYFGRSPYAGVFPLAPPVEGEAQVLYVDEVSVKPGFPFHWKVAGHSVYLFGGQLSEALTQQVKAQGGRLAAQPGGADE